VPIKIAVGIHANAVDLVGLRRKILIFTEPKDTLDAGR